MAENSIYKLINNKIFKCISVHIAKNESIFNPVSNKYWFKNYE